MVMMDSHLKLQKPLEDYIDFFEKMSSRTVPLLENLASIALSYNDPYHSLRGAGAVEALLKERICLYKDARYHIQDFAWARRPDTAYIGWSYAFTPDKPIWTFKAPSRQILEGVSEIVFDSEGKVAAHSEFWGAHPQFDVRAYRRVQPI